VLGLVELSITAAMSAALALAVAWTMRRLPAPAAEEGERS
jgi:hypothetical protein